MKLTKSKLKQIIKEELMAEKYLKEYEQYVDKSGYMHDDEGNKVYVGKGTPPGVYGLHDAPRPAPRRETERIKAIKAALASPKGLSQWENDFLNSVLGQLDRGRKLSDKQRKILGTIVP